MPPTHDHSVRQTFVKIFLIISLALIPAISSLVATDTASAAGRLGTDDYPDKTAVCKTGEADGTKCPGYNWGYWNATKTVFSDLSSRKFGYRNCTDFVAYRKGLTWGAFSFTGDDGNARAWKDHATNAGLTVEITPKVGDIAWWGINYGGGYGHVAVVKAVAADNSVTLEEYNQAMTGKYSNYRAGVRAEAYLRGGADVGGVITATTQDIALQANTSELYTYNTGGSSQRVTLGMKAGTSPAIAANSSGGSSVAFQANTGDLWMYYGNGTAERVPLGMKDGTSPAIVKSANGGFVAAIQANTGELYLYTSEKTSQRVPLGMMAGTSPSITRLNDGRIAVAIQANTGDLYVFLNDGSQARHVTLGLKTGTSPSITSTNDGGYMVAFQANTGELWTFHSNNTAERIGLGMMAGTSPSIAKLENGSLAVAIQANTGELYIYTTADRASRRVTLGMRARTSPAIAISTTGYKVAIQANTGDLYTVDNYGVAEHVTLGMMAGTSPAIK